MRRFALSLLLLAVPLQAWNATGHRIVAAIAYDHLNAKARARVDELVRRHPDLKGLLGRDGFLAASVWPDVIKGDSRFYDDTRPNALTTPLLPDFAAVGFTNMARHTNWHYIDIPFSPDGTPLEPPQTPNALIELRRILKEAGSGQLRPAVAGSSYGRRPSAPALHQSFYKAAAAWRPGRQSGVCDPGRNLHSAVGRSGGNGYSGCLCGSLAAEITAEFIPANGRTRVFQETRRSGWTRGSSLAKQRSL